jgi:hypothetical protein
VHSDFAVLYLRRFFEGFRCRLRPPAVCILYKLRETPPPRLPPPGGTVYEGLFFTAAEFRAYRKERVPLPAALERIDNGAKATGDLTQFRLLYHRVYVNNLHTLYS